MSKRVSKNKWVSPIDKEIVQSCIDQAWQNHGRDIGDIARIMGIEPNWAVYKWAETGRLPLPEIRRFEEACETNLITRYLAESAGCFLIEPPKQPLSQERSLLVFQKHFISALAALTDLSEAKADIKPAVKALTALIEQAMLQRKTLLDGNGNG